MKQDLKKYGVALSEVTKNATGHELVVILNSFIRLLAQKRLLGKIDAIIDYYEKHRRQVSGTALVKIKTARPLNHEEENDLIKHLTRVLKKPVDPRLVVDENLIGGLILQIDDDLIDGSVRGQLKQLKQKLSS